MAESVMWIAVGYEGETECGLTGTVAADQAMKMLGALDRGIDRIEARLCAESAIPWPTSTAAAESTVTYLRPRHDVALQSSLESGKAVVMAKCDGVSSFLLNYDLDSDEVARLRTGREATERTAATAETKPGGNVIQFRPRPR